VHSFDRPRVPVVRNISNRTLNDSSHIFQIQFICYLLVSFTRIISHSIRVTLIIPASPLGVPILVMDQSTLLTAMYVRVLPNIESLADWFFQQAILSVIGVPGALLAGYMVELPVLGRRGTLAISTRM
jgi:hypothetical protein